MSFGNYAGNNEPLDDLEAYCPDCGAETHISTVVPEVPVVQCKVCDWGMPCDEIGSGGGEGE